MKLQMQIFFFIYETADADLRKKGLQIEECRWRVTMVKMAREITIVRCLPQYESAKNAPRRGVR